MIVASDKKRELNKVIYENIVLNRNRTRRVIRQPTIPIREVTEQEYIEYHKNNGFNVEIRPYDKYFYEILTD